MSVACLAAWALSAVNKDIESMTEHAADADPEIASVTYESIRSTQDARQQAIIMLAGSFVVFLAALFFIRRMGRKTGSED